MLDVFLLFFFFFKQKTAYEMRISDWSSDVCSSDLWASTADDRTHPAHARKGAARLKALGQPYFYYEETTGGHSGGVDNDQRAQLQALQYVYLMQRQIGRASCRERVCQYV